MAGPLKIGEPKKISEPVKVEKEVEEPKKEAKPIKLPEGMTKPTLSLMAKEDDANTEETAAVANYLYYLQ